MEIKKNQRRTINITLMTHTKLLAHCHKHQLKVSLWADKVLADVLDNQASKTHMVSDEPVFEPMEEQ
jgi:hypothetical protein